MIIVKYFFLAIWYILKYTVKTIWVVYCFPGHWLIWSNYTKAGNGKGMDGIDEIARSERVYLSRHILAPIYSFPLWGLIYAFFLAPR